MQENLHRPPPATGEAHVKKPECYVMRNAVHPKWALAWSLSLARGSPMPFWSSTYVSFLTVFDRSVGAVIEFVGHRMKNIFFQTFGSAALLRELKILSILEQSPKGLYALALAKDAKAEGIPSSTVYAILGRLYAKSLVETSDYDVPHKGPRRTVYKLTPHGYAVLRAAEGSQGSELDLNGIVPS